MNIPTFFKDLHVDLQNLLTKEFGRNASWIYNSIPRESNDRHKYTKAQVLGMIANRYPNHIYTNFNTIPESHTKKNLRRTYNTYYGPPHKLNDIEVAGIYNSLNLKQKKLMHGGQMKTSMNI